MFLYKEHIRILDRLRPAAFVTENVKGFLSSRVEGQRIFHQVLADLRRAGGGPDSYRILPLVAGSARDGQEYVVRAEQFGVPQRRHRVILFGVRADLMPAGTTGLPLLDEIEAATLLEPQARPMPIEAVLLGMPALRSGLSRRADSAPA